jgi:hypothetical protein
MSGDCSAKKIGGKKVIHSQSREIVWNIFSFMKKEAEAGEAKHLQQVQKRVAEATGVSVSSVKRILAEQRKNVEEGKCFGTPHKTRPRRKFKTDIDDFDKSVIRRTIHEFHITHRERPKILSLLPVLRDKINFRGSEWALRVIVRGLGFRWRTAQNNRKILIEKEEIRARRLFYIRAIKRYRDEERPIIYVDETYIHSTHTRKEAWTDDSSAGLLAPVSKGNRAIIVHAGGELGFVPNALLIFQSGKKTGDYHDDMNSANFG